MELFRKSVAELSLLLRTRKISSVELTSQFLTRIHNTKDHNIFVDVNHKFSILQATRADELLGGNNVNELTGVPIAFKDMFTSIGWVTSAASQMLTNYQSPFNATVVKRCHSVGMVNIGKTNMDEFSMGSTGSQSRFGPTSNINTEFLIAGGSSSGSAAAVSSYLVPVAIGSDTGGSVRQPSTFANVVSLKPTYGRISRFGMIAFSSSLDQTGIIAHTAKDCSLLLKVLVTPDRHDSTTSFCSNRSLFSSQNQPYDVNTTNFCSSSPLNGLRVGVISEYLVCSILPHDVRMIFEHSIRNLELLGATITMTKLPYFSLPSFLYQIISSVEVSSNLSRYDGIRFGLRSCCNGNSDVSVQSRQQGLGEEVKTRIIFGNRTLSSQDDKVSFYRAHTFRRELFSSFSEILAAVDVTISPVCPVLPWVPDKLTTNFTELLSDAFTVIVNLLGLPVVSLPCGLISYLGRHLPVSIQLVGRPFSEMRLVQIAHTYQLAVHWFSPALVNANTI